MKISIPSTLILLFSLFSPFSAHSYEEFKMIVSSGKNRVSEVMVSGDNTTILTPDKAWTCKGKKSHEFIKALEQEVTHLAVTCKTGKYWFNTGVSCASQISKFESIGYPKLNFTDTLLGVGDKAYTLSLTCSTISDEMLLHEIKKNQKSNK